jgi:hypothetical protein
MQEVISLNILNTTNGTVPISILGNNSDAMDTSNATTRYQWNLTGFTITNENTIILQYRSSGSLIYTIYQIAFNGTTIQSICDSLNTLNLGYFFITTSGGSTFINNYNNNVQFGTLQVLNPATTTALNYEFNYSGVTSQVKIYVNAIVQYANGTPNTDSGNIPVVAGNTILFQGDTTAIPTGTNIFIYNITTSTYIYNNTTTSAITFNQTFTISANNSYLIGMNS